MKIWNCYGSEHSADLVMIGHFQDAQSAEKAKEIIDELTTFIGQSDVDFSEATRYPDEVLELLTKLRAYTLAVRELDQFRYSVSYKLDGKQICLTTDEPDISAFLKLMVDHGARLEVYSRPDYPDPGDSRHNDTTFGIPTVEAAGCRFNDDLWDRLIATFVVCRL